MVRTRNGTPSEVQDPSELGRAVSEVFQIPDGHCADALIPRAVTRGERRETGKGRRRKNGEGRPTKIERDTTPHRSLVISGEDMNQFADFRNRKSQMTQ